MILVFRLPRPPSTNRLYLNLPGRGRALTPHHRKWRDEAMKLIMVNRRGQKPIDGPYKLSLVLERKFGSDLGNLEKAVSDCLVEMQIVKDDALAEEIHMKWGDIIGCEVTVESVA